MIVGWIVVYVDAQGTEFQREFHATAYRQAVAVEKEVAEQIRAATEAGRPGPRAVYLIALCS